MQKSEMRRRMHFFQCENQGEKKLKGQMYAGNAVFSRGRHPNRLRVNCSTDWVKLTLDADTAKTHRKPTASSGDWLDRSRWRGSGMQHYCSALPKIWELLGQVFVSSGTPA